jgi:hypothetical protein
MMPMRRVLLLAALLLPCTAARAAAQGCEDPRVTATIAQLRTELGTPDVYCLQAARGDVDGDGGEDAVLDISVEGASGGNNWGSIIHVLLSDPAAPLLREPDQPRGQSQAVRIAGRDIVVETVEHRPDDPRCCPSLYRDIVLRVEGQTVVRVLGP